MRNQRLNAARLVLAVMIGWPAAAVAHLVSREESLTEAVKAATAIVEARVESAETAWLSDQWGNHIYTTYVFRSGTTAKGSAPGDAFPIRVMGGQVGDVTEEVTPGWRFTLGQDLVLFLHDDPDGTPRIRRTQVVRGGEVFVQGQRVPVAGFLELLKRVAADPTVDVSRLLAWAATRTPSPSRSLMSDSPTPPGLVMTEFSPRGAAGPSVLGEVRTSCPSGPGRASSAAPMTSTATIADAGWANRVNRDGDLYWSSATLVWDPDVVGGGSLDVFEKVFYRLSIGGTWFLLGTTPVHTISGTGSSDIQSVQVLGSGAPELLDFAIEIFETGASAPDYVRDYTNDGDLWMVWVEGVSYDAPPPVITSITPGKASAGTGTTVTITGTDFLPSQGNGSVTFFFKDGEPSIPGLIQSWSDTQIVCEVPVGAVNTSTGPYFGSAGSGPVWVGTDAGKVSNGRDVLVSFGYGLAYWDGANPTVQYLVGENLPSAYVSAVESAGNSWSSSAGIGFSLAGTTPDSVLSHDGHSEVMLGPLPAELPPTAIGVASCWMTPGVITECDLLLNSAMAWSTSTPTPSGSMDVETITLHEMGHWLKLLDLYGIVDAENDRAKVMFGFNDGGPLWMKRSLHADDIAGAQSIYGAPIQCTYSIWPTQQPASSVGGIGSVGVTAGAGCAWSAASNAGWLTVTGGASGSGNGTVGYSVQANTGGARVGTLSIAGQTFTVNQDALSCDYSINPQSASVAATGGTGSVGVTAAAGCMWSASSNANWLTVTGGASGTGNGTVGYLVQANTGGARAGTLSIAGQTFTVNQGAASCSYAISPTSEYIGATGGGGSFNVTAGAGCAWAAGSDSSWLHVSAGGAGSGNGTVSYSVDVNNGGARTGHINLEGSTFTLSQAAVACTYSIAPSQASIPSVGSTGSVVVTAGAGCAWSSASGVAWISVTYGATGSGNGTVGYAVAANSGSARSGTIAIADKVFTAAQDAQSCSYSLSPTTMSFAEGGGTGSFAVAVGTGCTWTAVPGAGWIHIIAGTSGVGPATVSFGVDANTGVARSGNIVVQGLAFTVSQSGVGCSFTLTPSSASVGPTGGEGTFAVASGAGCTWLAMPSQDWLHVLGSNTATGPGSIHYLVDSNAGSARDGTISLLQGPKFTVHQQASFRGMAFSHWLPAVAHTDVPSRNSHWRSDIAILNRSASTAVVELKLHLSGMVLSKEASVGPNAMIVIKDVVAELTTGLGAVNGSGALEVWSDQDLYLTGRTYNQLAPGQTYGQNYDGAEPDDALLSAGQSAWLPQLAQNALFRTNIGITNTSNASANVTLALFDTQGDRVWSGSRDLGAGEFYQYDQPFNAVGGMEQGYATVTVNSGSGITAYASVIDQATGDPTTFSMKR